MHTNIRVYDVYWQLTECKGGFVNDETSRFKIDHFIKPQVQRLICMVIWTYHRMRKFWIPKKWHGISGFQRVLQCGSKDEGNQKDHKDYLRDLVRCQFLIAGKGAVSWGTMSIVKSSSLYLSSSGGWALMKASIHDAQYLATRPSLCCALNLSYIILSSAKQKEG